MSSSSSTADRAEICARTAAALRKASPQSVKAVIGFDGFVDNIMKAVDKRLDADHYEPIATIAAFGNRIAASAGHSSNIELVRTTQKLGGNGPIFANALAVLGLGITYIGSIGFPTTESVFDEFGRRATLHGIAECAVTDAVEFDDGKLMLNKNQALADVNWKNIVDRVGLDALITAYDQSTLIGMANWTMLPHLTDIWRHVLAEVFPKLSKKPRHIFVDLADPAKRTDGDLTDALSLLSAFQKHAGVALGLNVGEAKRVAKLLGLGDFTNNRPMAQAIRDKLGLDAIVIHARRGAAAVTAADDAAIDGPFVQRPKITTGAGDHFNSGFCLGLSLDLKLDECLCCGVAVGGFYVSRAKSPTLTELADFIDHLPAPEGADDAV
ncbi:MAG: hypothetical protein JWM57_741 [Phycisphaerales bacterium]|nr:hypothetical protein [Phycisphaerales bacterium]